MCDLGYMFNDAMQRAMAMMTYCMFAVLIENHNLAETMRTVWQQLWDKLGPVMG